MVGPLPPAPPPGIPPGIPPGMPPGIPIPPDSWYIFVIIGLQTDSNSFCRCSYSSFSADWFELSHLLVSSHFSLIFLRSASAILSFTFSPPEVWKIGNFNDILLQLNNAVFNQNEIQQWLKGCILPFLKWVDLSTASNYRGFTLTSIDAKLCNLVRINATSMRIMTKLIGMVNTFKSCLSQASLLVLIPAIKAANLSIALTNTREEYWLN